MIGLLLQMSIAVASPATPATDPRARASIEAYIRHYEGVWAQGAVRNIFPDVRRFIADDYHGVTSRGKVADKNTVLASKPTDHAAGLYYIKTHFITPTLVIAQGEEWSEAKAGGPRRNLIWTDTWAFRDGRWQIVASQDSVVAPGQKPQE